MKQQVNDMVCFDSRCKAAGKQLFNSNNQQSQYHYDQSHYVECITRGSPFFRSINIQSSDFRINRIQMISAIKEVHENLYNSINEFLQYIFAKEINHINSIYNLMGSGLNYNIIYPHISGQTEYTDICLQMLNFKYLNRAESMKEYFGEFPKIVLSKINKRNKRLAKKIMTSLLDDEETEDANKETDTTYNIKQLLSELPERITTKYQAIKAQQISQELKNIFKFQSKSYLSVPMKEKKEIIQIQLQNNFTKQVKQVKEQKQVIQTKRFQRTEEQKSEINSIIVNGFIRSQVGYRYFPPPYRNLINMEEYRYYQQDVVMKVYKGIKGYIGTLFKQRERKYTFSKSDFKNYNKWMTSEQAILFRSCILKFSGLKSDQRLSQPDVYYIYLLIMVHMSKISKKPLTYVHPIQLLHYLNEKILYLYYHLQSLEKVYDLLKGAYPQDTAITPMNVMNCFKETLLKALDSIPKVNDTDYYGKFRDILLKEKEIGGQQWKPVLIDLTVYAITRDSKHISKLDSEVINFMKKKQGQMGMKLEQTDNGSRILTQAIKSSSYTAEKSDAVKLQQKMRRRQRVWDQMQVQNVVEINDNSMQNDQIGLDESQ